MRFIPKAGLALLGTLLALSAQAQELTGTLKKVKETGAITVGYRESSIPFSYLDDKQQPVGYAMDLCNKVVEAVKTELKMPSLKVNLAPVTSGNRIPQLQAGNIDLECGSTTNNVERQKQVSFTITHFLTANRYVSKKASNIKSIEDLKGKTVVSTSGTTNIKQATDLNVSKNMGMNIIPANGHPEAFQMVETGRAVAFIMDDILLYTLVASARTPGDYTISSDALSLPEPYGIMLRKDDPAFKKVVDNAMIQIYKSGDIVKIYNKWFTQPVPPKGINYNVPMSPQFKNLIANPTDSGDPAVYK